MGIMFMELKVRVALLPGIVFSCGHVERERWRKARVFIWMSGIPMSVFD